MENIDFLSPPITLFYFGKRTHTSKIGGLLVMLMTAIIFTYISYILIVEFSYEKVSSVFYKKYENEAGYYSFNTSCLFTFLQIAKKGIPYKYNHKNIRIYSYPMPSLNSDSESELEFHDHWVYDTCKENEDNKNLDENIFADIKNFSYGACIKYFYNSTEKKYISTDNPNFKWPYLEHGTSNSNNKFVNTMVTKCSNNSISNKILGYCNSEDEINQYLNDYQGIYLYFIDNLIDVTNYGKPLQSYFYAMNSNLGKGISYVDNYIHFSPLRLTTSEGLIFNYKKYFRSISYDQNRKGEGKNLENSSVILVMYHYLLQNNILIYERRYNDLLDVFSQIGGVVQMIFYIFYGINYLYNSYIVLYDTNHIFFNIDKSGSKINIKINDLKTILFGEENNSNYNNISNLNPIIGNKTTINHINKKQKRVTLNNPRLKTIHNFDYRQKDDSIFGNLNIKKENHDFFRISNENQRYLDDSKKIVNLNDNSIANVHKKVNKKYYHSEQFRLIKFFNSPKKEIENKSNNLIDTNNKKRMPQNISINLIKNEILSHQSMVIGKKFSFFVYMKMLCNKGIKNNMAILINFRKKLLSEEHLYKSHLTSFLFEKNNKITSKQSISFVNFYNEL